MAPNRKRLQSGKLIVKFMPKMANNWSLQSLALFNWNSSDFIQSELWRLSQNGQFPCAKPSALFYRLAISNFACVVGCFIIQEAVGPLFFFKEEEGNRSFKPNIGHQLLNAAAPTCSFYPHSSRPKYLDQGDWKSIPVFKKFPPFGQQQKPSDPFSKKKKKENIIIKTFIKTR